MAFIMSKTQGAMLLKASDKKISALYTPDLGMKQVTTFFEPIENQQTFSVVKRAKLKLRGYLAWNTIREEMIIFGSSPYIYYFDYTSNIKDLTEETKIKIRQRCVNETTTHLKQPKLENLFSPQSKFKNYWALIILFYLMYVFTGMPYVLAFQEVQIGDPIFFFELSMDMVFFLDIMITLNTAYVGYDGIWVVDRKKIFFKYLTGLLIVDIIAIFPFYLFTENLEGRSNAFIRFLRVTKLSRIFRGSKIMGVLKTFTNSPSMAKFARFIKTYDGITRLAVLLYITLLMAHFTACMWYFVARIEGLGPDSWVVRNDMQDRSKGELYLASFYYSFAILTTVGFGDIHAYSTGEMVISTFWMIFGVGFYSFVVGTITSVLATMQASNAVLKQRFIKVDDFSIQVMLPEMIRQEMKLVLKQGYKEGTLEEEGRLELIKMMPRKLKYKIALSQFDSAARSVLFFQEEDQHFISELVSNLQHKYVLDSHIIYNQGDYPDEIYFLVMGCVDMVIGKKNISFMSMHQGSHFGEIEMIRNSYRYCGAITRGSCRILVMTFKVRTKQNFNFMMKYFRNTAGRLIKLAKAKESILLQNLTKVKLFMRDFSMVVRKNNQSGEKKLTQKGKIEEQRLAQFKNELLDIDHEVSQLSRQIEKLLEKEYKINYE